MSAPLFRIRRQIKGEIENSDGDDLRLYRAGLMAALGMVDAEAEALAETEFLKPIKDDPLIEFLREAQATPHG